MHSIHLGGLAVLCSGVAIAAMPMEDVAPLDERQRNAAFGIEVVKDGGDKTLSLTLGAEDSPRALFMRAGVHMADAMRAGDLIADAAEPPIGTKFTVKLGGGDGATRPLEGVSFEAAPGKKVHLVRTPSGELQLAAQEQAQVAATPQRVRGTVGDGLYWSLRSAGASPFATQQYLEALATELDVGGDVSRGDSFDLVLGEGQGALLYAGIDRVNEPDLQLVRWTAAGRTSWINAADIGKPQTVSSGLAWPVAGRITSGFGMRRHPILGFSRMHRGVDFGASWGSPIVAAADGQVIAAGWAGGYGRQVRIAHASGLTTSYSHMSSITADQGAHVRRGQLIGYVGSSGLSTGPHLHYEVYRGGVPVNPLSVRFTTSTFVDAGQANAIKARLKQLLSVGA